MYPILFEIGPLSVHAYGFMLAIGFCAGILVTLHYAKKVNIQPETILNLAIYMIICALVGSRLTYVLGRWGYYKSNLLEIFMVQKGGLAFLGGLLLAIVVVIWFARRRGLPFLRLLDVLTPGTAVGYSIARIGCFLNGCCFGVPTGVPWGMSFPLGSLAHSYYGADHIHPTQLYAIFLVFAVFLIIVFLWKRKKYDGYVFFWFLVLYAVYRFAVEFFRFCPPELYLLGLNPGQVVALAMFSVGAIGLWRGRSFRPGA
jgi:phosphatidylglycerol:prolipoprotein diacylglycerol transferase